MSRDDFHGSRDDFYGSRDDFHGFRDDFHGSRDDFHGSRCNRDNLLSWRRHANEGKREGQFLERRKAAVVRWCCDTFLERKMIVGL